MKTWAYVFLILSVIAAEASASVNRWAQLWYHDTSDAECDSAASRYKYIVGGFGAEGQDITRIKHTNSAVRALVYITIDQYPEGSSTLMDILAEETSDVEGCFLHYDDDTSTFILNNSAAADDRTAGSKVRVRRNPPNYNYSYVPNYADATKRMIWRKTMVRYIMENPWPRGTESAPDVYPDGIWLDNASINLNLVTDVCRSDVGQQHVNWCTTQTACINHYCDGGHVTEANGYQIGSTNFQGWWRTEAVNKFTGTLGDTLRSLGKVFVHNAQPQPGAFDPFNSSTAAPFVGSSQWGGRYYFEYTPGVIYNSYDVNVTNDTTYVRKVRAREVAIEADSSWSWFSTHLGTNGYSIAETIRSNLAMYLVVRGDSTVFEHQGNNSAQYDSIIWQGCQRTVQALLGNATGAPYIASQGTDPTGKAYAIWARPYQNGKAFCRPRHGQATTTEAETAVTVTLSSGLNYYLLHPNGTYGPEEGINSVTLRNGYGQIVFTKSKVPPPEEIE